MTTLHLNLGERGYDINIGRGLIGKARELFSLERRVLIVTDEGVPGEYAACVARQCKEASILTLPTGEGSKSFATLELICQRMSNMGMTRGDCVVAVGGGMVGDVSGFAASCYMRGVDFYNIPTTLLSQVDSSIGGKTAINLGGIKNTVGAFYQPCGVIIDPDVLDTLPKRQIANGLAEAIKMALTSDEALFSLIESGDVKENIEKIITGALLIKKAVVEADERESGLRKILNLGHTLGHGIEGAGGGELYHGECVAIGLIPVCSEAVKERLIPLLRRVELPTEYAGDMKRALELISHDKKREGEAISVIYVDEIGKYRIEKETVADFVCRVGEVLK